MTFFLITARISEAVRFLFCISVQFTSVFYGRSSPRVISHTVCSGGYGGGYGGGGGYERESGYSGGGGYGRDYGRWALIHSLDQSLNVHVIRPIMRSRMGTV